MYYKTSHVCDSSCRPPHRIHQPGGVMTCTNKCNQGRHCDCGAVLQYHRVTTILLLVVLASMVLGAVLAKGVLG